MNYLEKFYDSEPERNDEDKKRLFEVSKRLNDTELSGIAKKLDERVVYDKKFLLEIQGKGYNPLDKEDVQRFLQNQPPKDLERNLKVSGANIYTYLGQGEYEELDTLKFMKKNKADISVKNTEDLFLSDMPTSWGENITLGEVDFDTSDVELSEDELPKKKSLLESEKNHRENLAKVFEDKSESERLNNETRLVDSRTSELLKLISELKSLGFSQEEIKKHINNLNRF